MPARNRFVFHTYRPKVANNAIRVDQALNKIGRHLYPDQWDKDDNFFKIIPLFISREIGLYTLKRDPERKRRFTRERVEKDIANLDALEKFSRTVERLEKALKGKAYVPAYSVSREGKQTALNAGILRRQHENIFGAGIVERRRLNRIERHPVWIKKAAFAAWLRSEFTPPRQLSTEGIKYVNKILKFILEKEHFRNLNKHNIHYLIEKVFKIVPDKLDVKLFIEGIPKDRKGGKPMRVSHWVEITNKNLMLWSNRPDGEKFPAKPFKT